MGKAGQMSKENTRRGGMIQEGKGQKIQAKQDQRHKEEAKCKSKIGKEKNEIMGKIRG